MKKLAIFIMMANGILNAMGPTIMPFNAETDKRFICRFLAASENAMACGDLPLETLKACLNDHDSETVVLWDRQRIGFVTYTAQNWELCGIPIGEQSGRINMIGITEESRHKGYGSRLVIHALKELREQRVNVGNVYI